MPEPVTMPPQADQNDRMGTSINVDGGLHNPDAESPGLLVIIYFFEFYIKGRNHDFDSGAFLENP